MTAKQAFVLLLAITMSYACAPVGISRGGSSSPSPTPASSPPAPSPPATAPANTEDKSTVKETTCPGVSAEGTAIIVTKEDKGIDDAADKPNVDAVDVLVKDKKFIDMTLIKGPGKGQSYLGKLAVKYSNIAASCDCTNAFLQELKKDIEYKTIILQCGETNKFVE